MRVLVTGASGYVATRVAARLERDGHEPVRFSRANGGDVTDPEAVAAAFAGVVESLQTIGDRKSVV